MDDNLNNTYRIKLLNNETILIETDADMHEVLVKATKLLNHNKYDTVQEAIENIIAEDGCYSHFIEPQDINFYYSKEEPLICDTCGKEMDDGYICEDDGTYYCCKECLEADLNKVYGKDNWRWDEEENSAGGYITAFEEDEETPLNIFYTEWY